MKKVLPIFLVMLFGAFISYSQTVIYDNGPLVNLPGGGAGGADVSHLHSGLTTFGYGHAVSTGFWIADDFIVPVNDAWTIDSLVFYAYQTGSGNISTIDEVRFAVWDGVPGEPGSSIVAGDTALNNFLSSTWSGIYRTNSTSFTNTDRPVMRTTVFGGFVLQPGTYWMQWITGGTTASGPWAPPITISGQTNTGNAIQYNPTTGEWNTIVVDTVSNDGQGFPFLLIGSSLSSINEVYMNSKVNIFPNPLTTNAVITIDNSIIAANNNLRIAIVDALGRQVQEINNVNSSQVNLNRNNLNAGVYFYELKSGNKQIAIGKFVIN